MRCNGRGNKCPNEARHTFAARAFLGATQQTDSRRLTACDGCLAEIRRLALAARISAQALDVRSIEAEPRT